ncbi:phosphotransferase family protein [Mycolicibacterium sp. XJ879]
MTAPGHITAIDDQAARAYLLNVADTLGRTVIPALDGAALSRAKDCLTILARLAVQLTAPNDGAQQPLQLLAELDTLSGREAVEADGAVLDAEEAVAAKVRGDVATSGDGGQRSFDRDGLEGFLRAHSIGGEATRIVDARPLAGGRSKQTVLLRQQGAAALPERFVLRQDWANSVVGTSVTPEFEVLRRLHAAGLQVPEPYLLESSDEALGAPFLLVGHIEGHIEGDVFDPPASENLALQFAVQLGRQHGLGDAAFDGLDGLVERSFTPDQLRSELETFEAIISELSEPNATIAAALDWTRRHIDDVTGPRVLVHGDLGFHNFLVYEDNLTGVLDWELAHLGHPAEDLGYIQGWVRKMLPWEQFMAAYHRAGGPQSSQAALDFYTLWAGLRLYSMLLQARAAIVSGALLDCEVTMCVVDYTPKLLHQTSVALREILARN